MPDLHSYASPYGGSSFAESMIGWAYRGIVEDYWRGEVLYSSRRQTLLYALYRQAATYVWLTPTVYVFGWSFTNIVLPSVFVVSRFMYNLCRGGYSEPDEAKRAPLFSLAMAMPIARPPYGIVRNVAIATTALVVAWVFLVSPFPERPISRPTCKDSDGRVFKQSDSVLAVTSLSILASLFVGSVLYIRFLHKEAAAYLSQGPQEDFGTRRRAQRLALLLAVVPIPGNVTSLVHVMKETVEQLTIVSYNWELIQDSVRKTVHFSEILVVTAFFHGAAVGVWSNAWLATHPVGRKGALRCFKLVLPLGVAALSFAPRFYKLTYRQDEWFWPPPEHTGADVAAYASEAGLVLLAVLYATSVLNKVPDATSAVSRTFGGAVATLARTFNRGEMRDRMSRARDRADTFARRTRERASGLRGRLPAFPRFRQGVRESAASPRDAPLAELTLPPLCGLKLPSGGR